MHMAKTQDMGNARAATQLHTANCGQVSANIINNSRDPKASELALSQSTTLAQIYEPSQQQQLGKGVRG